MKFRGGALTHFGVITKLLHTHQEYKVELSIFIHIPRIDYYGLPFSRESTDEYERFRPPPISYRVVSD